MDAPERPENIETRYKGRTLDEVVAFNAYVHLEQMSGSSYALIVETSKERACFFISSRNNRSPVVATETWREENKER